MATEPSIERPIQAAQVEWGLRRECGMPAPGTSWRGTVWAADGGVSPGRRVSGAGERGDSERWLPGAGCGGVVRLMLSSFMS